MENKTEIWKAHPEIDKLEVSTLGSVRVLDRMVSNEKQKYLIKGRTLGQYDNGNGYLQINVSIDGKKSTKYVHRLVAQTFIANPDNLPQVNHKDCNTRNNSVENLEWCTPKYNCQYREKYGVSRTEAAGTPVFAISLSTLKVSHFRAQREASRSLGFNQASISAVIKGRYKYTHDYWFVNADDKAVDLINQKLQYIDKTRLIAGDSASTEFISRVIAE